MQHKFFGRLAAVLLSFALTLSLAACGGKDSKNPPETTSPLETKVVLSEAPEGKGETDGASEIGKKSQEALELLYQCMDNAPQIALAAAYLGYRDQNSTSSLTDWMWDNAPGLMEEMPFIQTIPEDRILGGGYGDLYCLVPRDESTSLSVNRIKWMTDDNGVWPETGEVLYRSEYAEPVLVFVGYEEYEAMPNVEIIAVANNGAELDWYPMLDWEYTCIILPTDEDDFPLVLDFTGFGDVSGLDYTGDPEGDWWLPPTEVGLADTMWVWDGWSMELHWDTGSTEYAGTAEICHQFEDGEEYQCVYYGGWRMEDDCLYLELSDPVGTSYSGSYPVLIDLSGEQLYIQQARNGVCPPFFEGGVTSMGLTLSYG